MASTNASGGLLETLRALRSDPTRALDLYDQLYREAFIVLVESGSEGAVESFRFLTYDTADGLRGLPVFTSPNLVLANVPEDAVPVQVDGPALWKRLLDVVEPKKVEVEVDPGQAHRIRLRRRMILGMVVEYGPKYN
jgi:hypothetical protein